MMAIDRTKLRELFIEACDLETQDRDRLVTERCGDDVELREELQRLLENDESGCGVPLDNRLAVSDVLEALDEEELARPEAIGLYTPRRLLGAGGMGVVWLAEQSNPRRDVAVKVIRRGCMGRDRLRRFELEAAVLGRLQHPGIAQILEAGVFEDAGGRRPYFAMEYIDGLPLTEFARRRALSVRARLELFTRICAAVHHAHQRGVVHRDLKPANILVTDQGEPKVLDFGVARATDSDLQISTLRTDAGQLIGTLPYMSPEQVVGLENEIDVRSDVYALGVILYELLGDRLPFDLGGESIVHAARVIAEEDPEPLTTMSRQYRGDLNTIVLKALEKDPQRRYQSASDLASDIRRYLDDEPIVARPATTFYQLRKFTRRHKAFVAGVCMTFVALVLGVITTSAQAVRATEARSRAIEEEEYATDVNAFLVQILTSVAAEEQGNDVTIRDALDAAVALMEASPANQERVEASLRATIGVAYRGLGQYGPAEAQLVQALELRRSTYGPDHDEIASTLDALGVTLWHRGRYDDAEALYDEALAMRQRLHPDGVAATADTLGSLAVLHVGQARYAEAEQRAREAIAIHTAFAIDDHQERINAVHTLAAAIELQDRLDEAEAVFIQALDSAREHLGESHATTAQCLNSLGLLYLKTDRKDDAIVHLRRSLRIQSERLGEDHPTLAIVHYNLAMTLRSMRRIKEAETEVRAALAIWDVQLGAEHPYTLYGRAALGGILMETDRVDEAAPIFEEVLAVRLRVLGEDHPETGVSLLNMGWLHRARGEYGEAESYYQRVIDTRVRTLGPEHARTVAAMRQMAGLLAEAGDDDRAEEVRRAIAEAGG